MIALAWALCAWAELNGAAALVHHHALYHSELTFWQAALALVVAWQVMTAAMMLPSSLPMLRPFASASARHPHSRAAVAVFVAAYFAVWTAFAAAAFAMDYFLVHPLAHSWAWLAAHVQVIPAATFAIAAAYQMSPLLDACLTRCRHPGAYLMRHYRSGLRAAPRIGLAHAIFCLGCCWALMLVMFAAGIAHLYWMAVLAAVMVVEKGFPGGRRLVRPVGSALAAMALLALVAPGALPGF